MTHSGHWLSDDPVGIDLSGEPVLAATWLLQFRRLQLDNNRTKALFDEFSSLLAERDLLMRAGTVVDATIIAAPSTTQSAGNARGPELHQTKKANQWHFGMRAHTGVDAQSGGSQRE